jgi:multiple sugar transport system substrate-binding protein
MQGKMAGFFYSTYIMDDLALQEIMEGSLTGDNFPELTGADFDPELSDKTGFVPKISKLQPAGLGVVVSLGFFKQDDPAVTKAAKKFVEFLFTEDAYITFLHMAPGGMYPVLKKIAGNEKFLNDPKGIYKHYGKDKMEEIVSGLENLMRFDVVEGNIIQAYGKIAAQQIIPQMIYKITQEGMSVDKAMSWAEQEMKKAME